MQNKKKSIPSPSLTVQSHTGRRCYRSKDCNEALALIEYLGLTPTVERETKATLALRPDPATTSFRCHLPAVQHTVSMFPANNGKGWVIVVLAPSWPFNPYADNSTRWKGRGKIDVVLLSVLDGWTEDEAKKEAGHVADNVENAGTRWTHCIICN